MAAELLGSLRVFKSLLDTAKGIKDINDATIRNTVAIELQEKILAAQAQQTALIERISELERQVAEFETWDAEKPRYTLRELPPGVFVYALEEAGANGEPPHNICQPCYQRDKKSILNKSETINGRYHLRCGECGADVVVGERTPSQARVSYGRGGM
tara:strand:+ start:278 stop:748 length:471 start_codon:yes stop_codon:yes gene_type:complete